MLVISRYVGESFTIRDDVIGEEIRVTVEKIGGASINGQNNAQVKISIDAPKRYKIRRDEIHKI